MHAMNKDFGIGMYDEDLSQFHDRIENPLLARLFPMPTTPLPSSPCTTCLMTGLGSTNLSLKTLFNLWVVWDRD